MMVDALIKELNEILARLKYKHLTYNKTDNIY